MSDLISRQAALETLESGKDKTAKGDIGGFYNAIIQNDIDKLRNLPAAQPEVDCQKCVFCGFAGFKQFQTEQPDVPDTNVGNMISRQAAIDAVSEACAELRGVFGRCEDALNALPSTQKENILCKDCRFWVGHDRRCAFWNHGVVPFDWCSRAERRER